MNKKMTIERLDNVVRVLQQVIRKKRRFDIYKWTSAPTLQELHSCGTSACAIGYAAMDPWFNRRGLKFKRGSGLGGSWIGEATLSYKDFGEFHSVLQFFGLSFKDAEQLFTEDGYGDKEVTPQMVIDNIQAYTAGLRNTLNPSSN